MAREIVVAAGVDAIPYASVYANKQELPLAYIREGGRKKHGTRKVIEGRPQKDDAAYLILGDSMNEEEAVSILAEAGMSILSIEYHSFSEAQRG